MIDDILEEVAERAGCCRTADRAQIHSTCQFPAGVGSELLAIGVLGLIRTFLHPLGARSHRHHGSCRRWRWHSSAESRAWRGHSNSSSQIPAETSGVGRWPERGEQFRLHCRTRYIQRVVQVHLERDRTAAHQCHLHARPVLVRRVLHHRPSLQVRLAIFGENKTIRCLPHRRFDHIAHLHLATAFACEVQRHRLLLAIAYTSQLVERPAEFALHRRIGETQLLDIGHPHRPHAVGAPHVEDRHIDGLVRAGRYFLRLNAHNPAHESAGLIRRRRRDRDLDLPTLRLLGDIGQARVAVQVDGEAGQSAGDRLAAIVAHRCNPAAVEVLQDHTLEQVVDVGFGEGQIDAGFALDIAATREVADTRVE